MKKVLQLTLLFMVFITVGFSQTDKFWSASMEPVTAIIKDKAVSRLSFPKEFQLFKLSIAPLRQDLFTIINNHEAHSVVISLPNSEGRLEQFEVFEASNFEPILQYQFPQIRAFSGKGLTDKYATLKLSLSPQGIQTMVFRTDKENEFIEPYSQDHTVYAVFKSHRSPGQLPWTCSTVDTKMAIGLNDEVSALYSARSGGNLKTMRLAQSCNAEYSNYFGATSSAQVALVLAAFNATLTRCNGVYEKDLALHLNLIANTASVIYYNPATDPYSTNLSSWNSQLQSTLTSVIGEANYDIGHMFGASGGGGNAGCIGCICTNGSKGSGITSPADGVPQGDNFDIDYVVHEVGHQLGGNHTFSMSLESGTGVNKEVGSGITIMGYAGITSYDVAPHSIDIYHEATIAQIQANLLTKTCPVTTSISANNATPVVAAVGNYTIPKSTPFALTGSATDANAGDVLTYCWEQNDNATTSGSNSVASPTKTTGPNWLSFSPTASPTRFFPKLSTILAGLYVTPVIAGGDAAANIEALSSVARTLNFKLTVRDNSPYSSTAPVKVGQTQFTDMVVTVSTASGPFAVVVPNTAVSYVGGSAQTITWSVANTTAAPVSCANVKISLSTDGGQTFPIVLAASTANDGTEVLVIPNTATTSARIKVEAVGNIFFDISNANFTITAGNSFSAITTSAINPLTYCAGSSVTVPFTTNGPANAGNIFTAQLSNASGSFATSTSIGTLISTGAGTIVATLPVGTNAGTGYRIRVVSSNPVITGSDNAANISINVAPAASVIAAGGPTTFCSGDNVILSGNTTGGVWSVGGGTTSTLSATTAGDYYTSTTNGCGTATSNHIAVSVTSTITPQVDISVAPGSIVCAGSPVTFTATSTNGGTPPSFNWIKNGVTVSGGSQVALTSITLSPINNGDIVSCQMTVNPNAGSCVSPALVTSNSITMTVNAVPDATITPTGSITICAGSNLLLSATTGTGFNYQWRNNGVDIPGATASSYLVSASGSYSVFIINATGCSDISTATAVTVAALPTVSFTGLAGSYAVNNAIATLTGSPEGGTFSGTGVSGNSFNPAVAGVGGPYSVTYTYTNANGCSNFSTLTTTVTGSCAVPAKPGTITTVGGTAKVCPGDVKTYTIGAVSGATGYTWTAPSGGTVTSGQGTTSATVTYNSGFTVGDSLRVTADNTCGSSIPKALKINRNVVAATPGVITGQAEAVCNTGNVPYSIIPVAGNTYTWSWDVSSATITSGQGTNAIDANFTGTFVSGKLSVTATNACGSSSARTLVVYGRPALAASISGLTSVCSGQQAVAYSITPINNASSYIWYVPTSARISDGTILSTGSNLATTATNVTVNFGSNAGLVRVKGVNTCAAGSVASTTVAFVACRPAALSPENNFYNDGNFALFPNPSNGNFRIKLSNVQKIYTSVKIDVTNEFGQVVYQTNAATSYGMIDIDLTSKLTSGIYFVNCTVNGEKTVRKLIITK